MEQESYKVNSNGDDILGKLYDIYDSLYKQSAYSNTTNNPGIKKTLSTVESEISSSQMSRNYQSYNTPSQSNIMTNTMSENDHFINSMTIDLQKNRSKRGSL